MVEQFHMIWFGQCSSSHSSAALSWGFGSHMVGGEGGGVVGNRSSVLCAAGYAAGCSYASAPGWRGPGDHLQGKREMLYISWIWKQGKLSWELG